MGSHDALPDAILELIFLGLDSLLHLHRAASTCKRWRRIIASGAFRALHGAPPHAVAAGSYYHGNFLGRPRFEPSPSAAAAAIDRRQFSLDFLPGGIHCRWLIKDSHGSLLHLVRRDTSRAGREEDLIVCEPLTRRHELVPPPPMVSPGSYFSATAALLAGDDDSGGGGGIANGVPKFKVLWVVHNDGHLHSSLHAYLFTSGGGSTWRVSSMDKLPSLTFIGVAAGRRYWHDRKKKVFVLDQSTLEFSSFVLPHWDSLTVDVALTVGRDGEARIGVGGGRGVEGDNNMNMKIFARVQGGGSAAGEKWELEKTVQLSAAMLGLPRLEYFYLSRNLSVEAGTLKIRVQSPAPGMPFWWWFRLDMETMEAERLCEQDEDYVPHHKAYPFEFPWPSL
ncbi:unnamed protein product [Urochloa humidicola]